MPAEPGLTVFTDAGSVHCLQMVIPADTLAVREALVRMCDTLVLRDLPEDERGTVEIVMAEVLNNIVEHAYADDESGKIEVILRRASAGLMCQVVDQGRRMPDESLPEGNLPAISPDDLPEGGFGWHLIRTLSQDLAYTRSEGRNYLTFRLGVMPFDGQSG